MQAKRARRIAVAKGKKCLCHNFDMRRSEAVGKGVACACAPRPGHAILHRTSNRASRKVRMKHVNDQPIFSPASRPARSFTDPTEAVYFLTVLYDEAIDFIRQNFIEALKGP